jgi:hypothetical protein
MSKTPVTQHATTATTAVTRVIDWEAMEPDWRAGIKSKLELSTQYGVSRAAIDKHWAKAGIERDLTARIQAKADALVSQQAVTRVVTSATKLAEQEIVSANGAVVAKVRIGHRNAAARSLALCDALMAELEAQTFDKALMSELGTLMRNPNEDGSDRLNDIYRKVISMPGRVDTAKKLIETMKSAISLEREAYNIVVTPTADTPANSIAAFLTGLKRSALPVVYEVEADDSL